MTLVQRRAGHRVGAGAASTLAGVGPGAGVRVVARGPVGFHRIGASPRGRIAGPGVVALIERRAGHRVRPLADAVLARVGAGAGVAVAASGPVGKHRVLAGSGQAAVAGAGVVVVAVRVADALSTVGIVEVDKPVAIVVLPVETGGIAHRPFRQTGVDHGIVVRAIVPSGASAIEMPVAIGVEVGGAGQAGALLASIQAGTGVAVVTCGTVRLRWIAARPGGRVTQPRQVAVVQWNAHHRISAGAGPRRTSIHLGAGVPVVADGTVRAHRIAAASRRGVAGACQVARIERRALHRLASLTDSPRAHLDPIAVVVEVAGRPVRFDGLAALAGGGITDACIVALRQGVAHDRIGAGASAALAGVAASTGVTVVAAHAVRPVGVVAHSGRRIAGAGIVALIERGAHDRIRADAAAPLAGIQPRAAVAVVAGDAIGAHRVGALAGDRVALPRLVALVERQAHDRFLPHAHSLLAGVAQRAGVTVVARIGVGQAEAPAHRIAVVAGAPVPIVAIQPRTGFASGADAGLYPVAHVQIVAVFVSGAGPAGRIVSVGQAVAVVVQAVRAHASPGGALEHAGVDGAAAIVTVGVATRHGRVAVPVLIQRQALATAVATGVLHGAWVGVVARPLVGQIHAAARAGVADVIGAGVPIVAGGHDTAAAGTVATDVAAGAGVEVVARVLVGRVHAANGWVASIVGAFVAITTIRGLAPRLAGAQDAGVAEGAGVAVFASAIHRLVNAPGRRRAAVPGTRLPVVAIDGDAPATGAVQARVGPGAAVSIVARTGVVHVAALAGRRVAAIVGAGIDVVTDHGGPRLAHLVAAGLQPVAGVVIVAVRITCAGVAARFLNVGQTVAVVIDAVHAGARHASDLGRPGMDGGVPVVAVSASASGG